MNHGFTHISSRLLIYLRRGECHHQLEQFSLPKTCNMYSCILVVLVRQLQCNTYVLFLYWVSLVLFILFTAVIFLLPSHDLRLTKYLSLLSLYTGQVTVQLSIFAPHTYYSFDLHWCIPYCSFPSISNISSSIIWLTWNYESYQLPTCSGVVVDSV